MVVLARAAMLMATLTLVLVAAAGALVEKTIESEDGDIIDCVSVSNENRMTPERSMKDIIARSSTGTKVARERQQTWRKGGASCPDGTIPVRRHNGNATAMELTRGLSFSTTTTTTTNGSRFSTADERDWSAAGKLEVAAAYGTWGPYHGLRANLPYNKIEVNTPNEFSMTYVMVGYTLDPNYSGSEGGDPPNTLENQIMAGLVTWPALYNDSLSRLFVYYTNDGGVEHKCFNLECQGFVVTNNKYGLGSSWSGSDSQIGGPTYGIPIGIHRDGAKMTWWVSVEDVDIGYYPETVFNTRFPEGHYVETGGRVLDTKPGGRHTTTPMGNMMPPCAGTRFAATIIEYLSVSSNGQLFRDPISRKTTTTPDCYNVNPVGFGTGEPGYIVSYGGPGGVYCDLPQH